MINMNKPKILCYNIGAKLPALTSVATGLGVTAVEVTPESYALPLFSVVSGIKAEPNRLVSGSLPEGMLVFVNFPDALLDVFLAALRESSIRIPLKAVLTQHNAVWDAHTLYNELCREREEFSRKA